jgi:hypothetical protein
MYELKQRAIKEGVYPKRFTIPVLAQEFTKMVKSHGRVNETLLASLMFMKTDPLAALGMAGLGIGLMRTGRFSVMPESIEGKEQIARIFESVDNEKGQA